MSSESNLNNKNNFINNSFLSSNPSRNINKESNFFGYNNSKNNNLDESFKYNYYLLENLKNSINKIDIEQELSNIL
jgi:hypothetical protein